MSITIKHLSSHFPMLQNHRRNDTVHSDTLFSSAQSTQGYACSQMIIGEKPDFIHFEPM